MTDKPSSTTSLGSSSSSNNKLDVDQLIKDHLEGMNSITGVDSDGSTPVKIRRDVINRAMGFRKQVVRYTKKGEARVTLQPIGETISDLALIGLSYLESKRRA